MARRFRFWQILFVIGLGISILLGQVSGLKAQTANRDLVQQGITEYQQGRYKAAIKNWNRALSIELENNNQLHEVIILENIARAYQKLGQTEKEIALWQDITELYQQLGSKQLGRSLTELAQAYSSLGQHRKAIAILCGNEDSSECRSDSAIAIARETTDSLGEIAAKGSLGEAYRLRGDYTVAVSYLEDSFKIAQALDLTQLELSALNSLGNTYSSLAKVSYRQAESAETREEAASEASIIKFQENGKEQDKIALNYFQQSFDLATKQEDSIAEVRSLIGSIPIYYRLADFNAAANSRQQAINLISTLPLESTTIYTTIDLAKLLQPEKVSFSSCYDPKTLDRSRTLLQQAVESARQLGDNRVTSFALGELGHTYECSKDYQQALEITKQARFAAEREKDSLYLWEWQTGRILYAKGKQEDGIAAYETAIATLESIRDDILTANRDVQFDFRDTVEPIYRELIKRRLGSIDNISVIEPSQTQQVENVNSILTTSDSLRLAELQNYFGNDCAINDNATIEGINLLDPDPHTAYFSTIILEEGTAIIVNFPGGKSKIVWNSNKGKNAIAEEINQYRTRLQKHYVNATWLGQDIYSWLIKPFAEDLQREQITTLVFIHDGLLRSIPMSALHDGEQFLIQKYAIATTPSLNLVSPTTLERQKLKILALGLSKASLVDNRSFPPLPNVETEIASLGSIFEESTNLLNDDFSRDRLQQELAEASYPIVHIATHGEFSSEPEDTFLITGKNEKLTINQLDRIIRSTARNEPLSLISLTACETAVGDERAALGLAGVAIQAGASSALASLWAISDGVTPVAVKDFYLGLQDANLSKAVALQKAQIALIEQDIPPAFWSPFILIGNWK